MDLCGKDCLTEEDIDRIAERAAEKAFEKVYAEIGRSVVKKFLWIAGAIGIGFAMGKGWIRG